MTYFDYLSYVVVTFLAIVVIVICAAISCAVIVKLYDWWQG